jgi:hypothetical protein
MLRRKYTPPPRVPAVPLPKPPNYATNLHRVAEVPKEPIFRSRPYRMYVAAFGCMACGIEKWSQCAHSNQARHGKAGARKASDEYTFPLCSERPGHMGCHRTHDLCEDMTKAERDALEDRYIAQMQRKALHAGWRFTGEGILAP